jgi:hypothetical protein
VALYEGAEKHFGSAVEVFCNNAGINHVPGWRKCMDIDIVSNEYSYTVLSFIIFAILEIVVHFILSKAEETG